jgi:hypothetical protein
LREFFRELNDENWSFFGTKPKTDGSLNKARRDHKGIISDLLYGA